MSVAKFGVYLVIYFMSLISMLCVACHANQVNFCGEGGESGLVRLSLGGKPTSSSGRWWKGLLPSI